MKHIVKKVYSFLLECYDRLTCKVIEVSIGDIILSHPYPDFILFLAASRYLDAKHYCTGEDCSFKYMHGISQKWHGDKYSPEKGEKKFKDLIESYQQKGYDPSSLLVMDKDLYLDNGTHRLGLCLLNGVYTVNARVIRRRALVHRTLDWYYDVGLKSDFLLEINEEYEHIKKMLIEGGHAFRCRIEGDSKTITEDIRKDLSVLCGCPDIFLIQEDKVYAEYSFSICNPNYVIDGRKGQLSSVRAVEIEKILKKRYECNGVIISISKNCVRA